MTTPLAIITGGAQGIGLATVKLLLKDGWRVAALDRDPEAVAELDATYPEATLLAMVVNVGDELQVKEAFHHLSDWQLENDQSTGVDLLVNNAGIADPVCGPIEELALEDWRRWQESHLTGAFLCTRAAVPGLRRRGGAIVNIASTRALQSEPHCESYAAAKGGLLSMTHALAISLGPDIRVNAICPGWIETGPWQKAGQRHDPEHRDIDRDQHPVGRVGEPADVAATVAFLASDKAGFITGQHISVDGGMTKKMIYAD
ncbi:short-chain dehydrogenase [Salinicola sp. MH3R3-1]|uniref:SDR family NAD(P)-dependent oxidoreductase n=2 Tax=Salinicola sp. MH3R3-1 TaxID=1928762 RepID=UPI00094F372D|nr:SDR family oxidoreductase [Salinicola sp. MH3R3-1]OLO07068.1 short-chain dehydrogenase [Salinicola sp. MH3R3-1]